MLLAELEDGGEFEGVAEGVRHHDGLGFPRGIGGIEEGAIGVAGEGFGVDENGDGTALDDGGDGGREAGGDGDDLVAGADALVIGKLVSGERGEGDEVGGRAGIDEEAVLHTYEGSEFLLHGFALGTQGEPEV